MPTWLKSLCSKINIYAKIADTLQIHCFVSRMLNCFEIWEAMHAYPFEEVV
jgi:hypothetical protein